MKKQSLLWIISFFLTLFLAYYQKATGPSYPISGSVLIDNREIDYRFDRTHGGESDHIVSFDIGSQNFAGTLLWKRYKVNENWNKIPMINNNGVLTASLPHQPPAGKLVYKILLDDSKKEYLLPEKEPVIIRFKGEVPISILIVHIVLIFLSMLLSTRTGLEIFSENPSYKNLIWLTLVLFILGGFVLGPIVQKYAFGEYWTGFPFGTDLTDNKVLLAFLAWLPALFLILKNKNPKKWIIFAAVFMFIVFLIPHSLFGSELDYNQNNKKNIEEVNSIVK